MNNMSFIPYWYRQKKMNFKCRIEKIMLLILVVCNLIVMNLYFMDINKLNDINNNMKTDQKAVSLIRKKTKDNKFTDSSIDRILKVFAESIYGKVQYKHVEIQDDKIEVEIPFNNDYECVNAISKLESIPDTIIDNAITQDNNQSRAIKVVIRIK